MRSLAEFEESTAFERWMLEALVPLPARRPHQAVKDSAANHVWITVESAVVRVYAGGIQEVQVDFRPLAFGAAWKVLDLLLELAYANAGTGASGGWLTIAKKKNLARQGHGVVAPLIADRAPLAHANQHLCRHGGGSPFAGAPPSRSRPSHRHTYRPRRERQAACTDHC